MTHLQDVLATIDRLEPFPPSAVRVLELALADAPSEEIVAEIEKDPGLTAKVLRLANSARWGSRVEIETVFDAANRLGTRAVASLALTTGAASVYAGYGASTSRSNASLWRECLYTANFARRLAADDGRVEPELAYTVALMQNVGQIVLDRFADEERERVRVELEDGADLLYAERAALGLDHAQCGARIARRWGFPRRLVRGIQYHHAPRSAGDEELLCQITGLAEDLALALLAGRDGRPAYLLDLAAADLDLPGPEELARLEEDVARDIAELDEEL